MKRPSSWPLCGGILLLGIAIGAGFDSLPLGGTVQADARGLREADRLYQELEVGGNPLIESSQLLAKIATVTTPSVVHIQSERRGDRGGRIEETGSGVVIASAKASGEFVVTNRHVVAGAELSDISLQLHDGRLIHPTRVWTDRATDIAIMRIPDLGLTPARWGDSDQVSIGHMVLAMGSPFGLSRSVTLGIISAKGRRSLKLGAGGAVLNQDFLQTDAAINPGNSGGPLIDLHGRVIGINTAIASNSGGNDGIGFSIPSNLVRQVADQLIEHGQVRRAYLGIKLDSDFDVRTARRLQLDRVRGARVLEIYPQTPAARADLKMDDVILRFNGIDVQDENHLINLVSLTQVGRHVELSILRDGRRLNVEVYLTERPDLD